MIEINLLPGVRRKTKSRGPSIDVAAVRSALSFAKVNPGILGSAVVIAAAIIGAGWMYVSQARAEEALIVRIDAVQRDSARLAKVLADHIRAEATRDTILRQVNLVRTIDEDRFIWPHIVDEVSRALPQYTWVVLIAPAGTPQGTANVVASPRPAVVDSNSPAFKKPHKPKRLDTEVPRDVIGLRIEGQTLDIEAITRFMRQLEASPFLSDVVLQDSKSSMQLGTDVRAFALTMSFTRPDTSMIRRLPFGPSVR